MVMKKISILIGIGIILVVGFLVFWAKPADNQGDAQSPTAVDASGWKTYRNEDIGIEFRYPSSDTGLPQLVNSNEQFIDRAIDEDIYIKVYKLGVFGPESSKVSFYDPESSEQKNIFEQKVILDSQYYQNLFDQISNYKHDQECNQLDAFIPIYGPKALNDTCMIFISDSGVRILTGFYANIHGGPPMVSLFASKNYEILLMLSYEDGLVGSGGRSFVSQQELVGRIENGDFPEITKKIEKFKSVLKTVRLIQK